MEKTLIQKTASSTYSIEFDFTGADQKAILQYLQQNDYQLMGFRGAKGPNQISSGVPAWFSIYFTEMFGLEKIDCEFNYFKVFVSNKAVIKPNEITQMQLLSPEILLGTALDFNPDGSFSVAIGASEGAITVNNRRGAGTPNITIGLAAKVNGRFLPFCAFTCASQGTVKMEPNGNIALFASPSNVSSGTVMGNAVAPGCKFIFNAENPKYDLEIVPKTYSIRNVVTGSSGKSYVESVPAGASLIELLDVL